MAKEDTMPAVRYQFPSTITQGFGSSDNEKSLKAAFENELIGGKWSFNQITSKSVRIYNEHAPTEDDDQRYWFFKRMYDYIRAFIETKKDLTDEEADQLFYMLKNACLPINRKRVQE